MDSDLIKVKDLAKQLKRDRSIVLKRLKKLGYDIGYTYDNADDASRGQKLAVIRKKDAERFLTSLHKVKWTKTKKRQKEKDQV